VGRRIETRQREKAKKLKREGEEKAKRKGKEVKDIMRSKKAKKA